MRSPTTRTTRTRTRRDSLLFLSGDWYVVHTYAGYENKVKANLASRIQSMNMEDKIYDVVVPTEEVMELKSGKMQAVQKKVFPGYILVRMELDDDSWYVVRNTPGVTGFVGSGAKPTPLDAIEVSRDPRSRRSRTVRSRSSSTRSARSSASSAVRSAATAVR